MTDRQARALAVVGVLSVGAAGWAPTPAMSAAMIVAGAALAALAAYDHVRRMDVDRSDQERVDRTLQRRYRRRETIFGTTYQGTPNRADIVDDADPVEQVRIVRGVRWGRRPS